MGTDTVQRPGSGRRVVRRRARPALDQAIDTALADLPPAIRPLVIRYADNMRQGQEIRSALSSEMTSLGLRWRDIDSVASALL